MGDNENYLGLYGFVARLPLPKSYIGKILLAAFIGTHVPLLALLAYFVFAAPITIEDVLYILAVVLIATLAGPLLTSTHYSRYSGQCRSYLRPYAATWTTTRCPPFPLNSPIKLAS